MNKLKKIGITALAGTMASISAAQAGAVSVNGTAELSWTNLPNNQVTGQQMGRKKNITFSGSGEFSNGWSYGITHVMNDTFTGMSSSSMNLNMGGIFTLAYDVGTGGYGANAVDNVVPTAWEEIDYGFSTGITDVGAVTKTKGVVNLTMKAPSSGTALSLSFASRMGNGNTADGGAGGAGGSGGKYGFDAVLDLWNIDTNWFDMRTGLAAEKVQHPHNCRSEIGATPHRANNCVGQKGHAYAGTIYQTLGLGPLSAGFQATYKDPGTAGGTERNESWVAGVALTIGSYMSVSCGRGFDEYYFSTHQLGSQVVPDDEATLERIHASFRGCSAALNWGPLALKGTKNKVSNQGGKHDNSRGRHGDGDESHSEINLSMAF